MRKHASGSSALMEASSMLGYSGPGRFDNISTHLRRRRTRTGPGSRDAHAAWLWPVLPGSAAHLELLELRLEFLEVQVLELKPLLGFLNVDLLRLEPLKLKLLDSRLEIPDLSLEV
ncbi:hypothetical protein EYF80_020184 [Liparis tanakae]|uniref:Uncharacterized protein n=1 Tax=Liparis tanakae TaxID=230148 RepID=A0A4Z2HUN9_9TELE|nr:hypothetical protein EYF80_020184 [Liparis tanakae]